MQRLNSMKKYNKEERSGEFMQTTEMLAAVSTNISI